MLSADAEDDDDEHDEEERALVINIFFVVYNLFFFPIFFDLSVRIWISMSYTTHLPF